MADEAKLAEAEAIKRFRAAVRLELSIAGDYIIRPRSRIAAG